MLPDVLEMAAAGAVPGGSRDNLAYVLPHTRWVAELSELSRLVLADAQTSGGLLITLPPERADDLVQRLQAEIGDHVTVIGKIVAQADAPLIVG
jgi:selenide,water dikinase